MSDAKRERRELNCSECGRPWGIIWPSPLDNVTHPADRATLAVHVSDADARFLSERIGCDMFVEDCYQSIENTDIPGWWWARRAVPAIDFEHRCLA